MSPPPDRPSRDVGSITINGRVYIDAVTLIAALRATADWHEAAAQAVGEPFPPGQWDEVASLHATARRFGARADFLDAACIERVSEQTA